MLGVGLPLPLPLASPSPPVGVRPDDVRGVQERGPVQADLDEHRLHARHDPLHPALVDIAHIAAFERALDVDLLQHAVFDHGHAGFAGGDVDQDFFTHRFDPSLIHLYSCWIKNLSMQ